MRDESCGTARRLFVGDAVACDKCGHTFKLTAKSIASTCERAFPQRLPRELFDTDLTQFACSACGERAGLVARSAASSAPATTSDAYDHHVGREGLPWRTPDDAGVRAKTQRILSRRGDKADPLNAPERQNDDQ